MSNNLDDYIRKLPVATQDLAWDLAWVVQGSADQVHEGWSLAKNFIFSSSSSSDPSNPNSTTTNVLSSTTSFFQLGGGAASPPPPPLAPPPLTPSYSFHSLTTSTDRFVRAHPYAVGGSALVLTGATVAFVGLGREGREVLWRRVKEGGEGMSAQVVQRRREREEGRKAKERPLNRDGHRMEVVVLLGADASPLGFPLALFLESQGFIVVASVSTTQAGAALEKLANGFVRAIVLDASEASSVDPFLSSLKGVLTLKFPIHSAGDPYASSSAQVPTITSVISLLALVTPSPSGITTASPLTLQAPLLTPLAIVTNLLPKLFEPLPTALIPSHLRASTTLSTNPKLAVERVNFSTSTLIKKIVVFLPAAGSLYGPGRTNSKVATDSVRTAFRTLASEIETAANNTFDGERPSLVKVEIVDLGFISSVRNEALSLSVAGLKVLGGRLVGWLRSWIGGRRVWSGFEVLERSVKRSLLKGAGTGRGAFGTLTFGLWGGSLGRQSYGRTLGTSRVGAGSWTYTYLPSLIPTSVMSILLRRASPPSSTTVRPLPSSASAHRPLQSDAARAAGQAAAQRQQTAPPLPTTQGPRTSSEPSDDDEGHHTTSDTDSVPSSMEASTSGLGDSWVHDPTGRNGAGGGEVPLGESWADGTWGRN